MVGEAEVELRVGLVHRDGVDRTKDGERSNIPNLSIKQFLTRCRDESEEEDRRLGTVTWGYLVDVVVRVGVGTRVAH
jgi:hypothetical protein